MHISEGVLSPAVLGAGAVLAAAGIVIGLRKLDYDRLMTVAILAERAVFLSARLASLDHTGLPSFMCSNKDEKR